MTINPETIAGRRQWVALAVLCVPIFLVAMDVSILYLAIPSLTVELAATGPQQLWIVDIYGFLIAGLLVTMGTLGDRIGRKKLLFAGGAGFGAASVLAAFSASAEMLIVSRALLGVAGAAMLPSVLALVTGLFADAKRRGVAMSIYLTCFLGGATLGPLVGGLLLEQLWWGAVFLVSVPGIVLLLAVGPGLLSEQQSSVSGRLDPASVVLSVLTILPFVYGLKELTRHGWQWFPALMLLAGVGLGIGFVRRQRHLREPLLDLRLFGNRTFSSALTLTFVTSVVGSGIGLVFALYMQNVVGLSPLEAGLALVLPNLLMVAGILGSPWLGTRINPVSLIIAGLVVAGAGYLLFLLAGPTSGPGPAVIALSVVMVGTGPLASFCNTLTMGAVPPEQAGSGASILQTSNEFGLGLGIAVLGTISAGVYRGELGSSLSAMPAAAQESVDRAIAAARDLPGDQAGVLVAAAREAFTSGFHVVVVTCAVLYAALALLAVRSLKPRKRPDSAEPRAEASLRLA